jgi:hypothetical protein
VPQLAVSEDGNELTGGLTGDIVNAEQKGYLLEMIAKENGIPLQQVSPRPLVPPAFLHRFRLTKA